MKILEDLEAFFEVTKRSGVELVFRFSVIWDVDLVVRERERERERERLKTVTFQGC